jgi:hypothetical protein
VSQALYYTGFATTLGAAVLYGLMMPVMELSQARHAARTGCAITYTLVMEMQIVIGFIATAFCAVGMLLNKDFHVSLSTYMLFFPNKTPQGSSFHYLTRKQTELQVFTSPGISSSKTTAKGLAFIGFQKTTPRTYTEAINYASNF